MVGKKTQIQKIIEKLEKDNEIDNFWAIDNHVSYRLGARIWDLKKLGWEFRTEKKGKNWYYYPTTIPKWPTPENNSLGNSLVSTSEDQKRESVLPVAEDTGMNNSVKTTGREWRQDTLSMQF